MPMKILGLEIGGKNIRQNCVKRVGGRAGIPQGQS
jgi:hypothetical protein